MRSTTVSGFAAAVLGLATLGQAAPISFLGGTLVNDFTSESLAAATPAVGGTNYPAASFFEPGTLNTIPFEGVSFFRGNSTATDFNPWLSSDGVGLNNSYSVYLNSAATNDFSIFMRNFDGSSGTPTAGGYQAIGIQLANNTNQTITQFTFSYVGEQRLLQSSTTASLETLQFDYSTSATSAGGAVGTEGWVNVPELTYNAPFPAGTVDPAFPGSATVGPFTVTGLSWAPGTTMFVRFRDLNVGSNDGIIGVNSFSFTAVPEPTSLALLGVAGVAALRRRRA